MSLLPARAAVLDGLVRFRNFVGLVQRGCYCRDDYCCNAQSSDGQRRLVRLVHAEPSKTRFARPARGPEAPPHYLLLLIRLTVAALGR